MNKLEQAVTEAVAMLLLTWSGARTRIGVTVFALCAGLFTLPSSQVQTAVSRVGWLEVCGPAPQRTNCAAQEATVSTVGVLVVGIPNPNEFLRALREGLRDAGFIDGQNLRFDIRSAEGNAERLPNLAAELVRRKVDVIVGFQTPAVQAAKQATAEIPIVMDAGDPVGMGLVSSLASPGGVVIARTCAPNRAWH